MKKIIILLLLCPYYLFGQMKRISLDCDNLFSITSTDYMQPVKEMLHIDDANISFKVVEKKTIKKENGEKHLTLQEYYNGTLIEYAIIKLHFKDDKLHYINGVYRDMDFDAPQSILSQQEAFGRAISYVNAEQYIWDDPGQYAFLKENGNKDILFPGPEGELVYYTPAADITAQSSLTYKFNIYATSPFIIKFVYIDCITGNVVGENSLIHDGVADTRYSGNQTICTQVSSGNYVLRSPACSAGGPGALIETKNLNNSLNHSTATDFTDNDDNWSSAEFNNSSKDNAALDVHWAAEQTYNYFLTKFGRNSVDNAGMTIKSYVHAGGGSPFPENANFDDINLLFNYGDGGTTFSPLTSIDVVAHEIAHGIAHFHCNLAASGESNAINEGLGDIWGSCVERYVMPGKQTWLSGEDIVIAPGKIAARCIFNPKATNVLTSGPDTYHGANWHAGGPGQAHTNSLVLSHWFFFLVEGGLGTNDNGDPFHIFGIGMDKAAQIVYKAMTENMTSTSDYADTRVQTVKAARDLFGDCSPEVVNTIKAWHAAGVGLPYPMANIINVTWPIIYSETDFAFYVTGSNLVGPSAIGEFKAVNSVILEPGFEAKAGATFLAHIAPCTIVMTSKNGNTGSESAASMPGLPIISTQTQIQVYPNPTQDKINITYPCLSTGQLDICIKDVSGRVVHRENILCSEGNNQQQSVDISSYVPGVYFIDLTLNDQHVVKKIVKL